MAKKKKGGKILNGVIRIKTKDLLPYEKITGGWKKSRQQFPEAMQAIKFYRKHHNLKILVDQKNPQFLRGQLSPQGTVQGARIKLLPDGTELDKAFPLFAKHLTIHDQETDDHWDIIYQNNGGTYAYCYALEKTKRRREVKYQKVSQFARVYPRLWHNVISALSNQEDNLVLPMLTLLKTQMRIGNEIYYHTHGHKGLTTLKKKDIMIKGRVVTFNYIAKDGVPRLIEQKFPYLYIKRLKNNLKKLKSNDFIFNSPGTMHPLREAHFKKAFKQYCGREFYPHIVRSYYATKEVKDFLKSRKTVKKEEVDALFLSIAAKLGHKRFLKKENRWKDNYTVTVNHYVQPELVEKIKKIIV